MPLPRALLSANRSYQAGLRCCGMPASWHTWPGIIPSHQAMRIGQQCDSMWYHVREVRMSPLDDPSPLLGSLASLGRVGVIGVGAAGAALARMLAARGADLAAVASRAPERAALLAAVLPGAAVAVTPDQLVRACDLVFLAVPDDTIAPLAAALPWRAGQGAVHLSGAKDAAALGAVSAAGAHPAALHPLMTFARAPLDTPVTALLERVAGCTWALEADDVGLAATLAR